MGRKFRFLPNRAITSGGPFVWGWVGTYIYMSNKNEIEVKEKLLVNQQKHICTHIKDNVYKLVKCHLQKQQNFSRQHVMYLLSLAGIVLARPLAIIAGCGNLLLWVAKFTLQSAKYPPNCGKFSIKLEWVS